MKTRKILITAGGTSEKIDEVRRMSNISTGRLGALIAEEFVRRGAAVTYVCGETALTPTAQAEIIRTDSVDELIAVLTRLFAEDDYAAVIHAMAVSDYRPVQRQFRDKKISSDLDSLVIYMEKTPKVIGMIREMQPNTILVGFKLLVGVDTEELLQVSEELRVKNNCDYVLANDLEKIHGDKHEGFLVGNPEFRRLGTKQEIAEAICEKCQSDLSAREKSE
jgi:phosphopantothenate-cysteine ligase